MTEVAPPGALHDLFARPDGRRVQSPDGWPAQAAAWRSLVVEVAYGGLPASPSGLEVELLCESRVRRLPGAPRLLSYRLQPLGAATRPSFGVQLLLPDAEGPIGAIACGDGCWWNLGDDVLELLAGSSTALAWFDRTEVAADPGPTPAGPPPRRGGLYDAQPGATFGALAAWAWAFHRCVDLLRTLPAIDPARIAVTGFSRGGKAALVAGATDERIALVHDHASGAGGAAPFRHLGQGAESIDVAERFPAWFGPELLAYRDRPRALPFDQHCLLAAIAPRPLLLTYAADDRWSNPEGMIQSAWAAGEVYRFLGHPDALAFHVRAGGHAHTPDDWATLLDFVGWRWWGRPPTRAYGRHPYGAMAPSFGWRAPTSG
jgi:hypothetical protein